MSFATYSDLKTAIAAELDRDDLSSKVDDFIDLAEARHKRDIRIREMITREAITVNDEYVNLPDNFLECINIRLATDPITVLSYMSPAELTRFKRAGTGKPRYFTVHGTEFEFDVDTDASYTGQIVYYEEVTALSDANTSNAILVRAPDAYFYASLLASAPYLMNDERLNVWSGLYREAVEGLSNARKQDRSVGPMVARIQGGVY